MGRRISAAQRPTPAGSRAKGKDFVFACVGNDDDLREVTIGANGAFRDDGERRDLHRQHHGVGRGRARTGEKAMRRLRLPRRAGLGRTGRRRERRADRHGAAAPTTISSAPSLSSTPTPAWWGLMGRHGAGQLTKMINQICIAGLVQGLAEGIHFGKKAGLDIEKVIEVISKGAAGSWQMENRHKTMNAGKYDFGFAVDWMRKDLGICLAEADRNGAKLPVTALVDQFYKDVQAMGGRRWDTSSLLARLEKLRGGAVAVLDRGGRNRAPAFIGSEKTGRA
jgi:3-hydroxyisobutyrate dehydrogenase